MGLNYAAHAAESNVTPPEHPVIFLKPLAGDADEVDPMDLALRKELRLRPRG